MRPEMRWWAAPTFDGVLRRAELFGGNAPLRDRLVSVVFANPSSLVITDLDSNRVLWDELTGESWDLFFAGYYRYGGYEDRRPVQLDRNQQRGDSWMFSPRMFAEFMSDMEQSMARARLDEVWRFSGSADVVSFMVYGGEPDWHSLRAVELCELGAPDGAPRLGRVVEGLRRWPGEEPDSNFAPGEDTLGPFVRKDALRDALLRTASAAAGAAMGSVLDEIIRHLLR